MFIILKKVCLVPFYKLALQKTEKGKVLLDFAMLPRIYINIQCTVQINGKVQWYRCYNPLT